MRWWPLADRAIVEPLTGCPAEIGYSLWTLNETRRRTVNYVKRTDPDTGEVDEIVPQALDLRPTGHRHSVATLLYHIAVFEMDWLYTDILGLPEDEDRMLPGMPGELHSYFPYPILEPGHVYTPVSGEPLSTHLDRLAVSRRAFIGVVSAMTLTDFRTPCPSGDDEVTPEWVVEHLSQHEAEHRGQIWEARIAAERELTSS